jgi:hypothetical protein
MLVVLVMNEGDDDDENGTPLGGREPDGRTRCRRIIDGATTSLRRCCGRSSHIECCRSDNILWDDEEEEEVYVEGDTT